MLVDLFYFKNHHRWGIAPRPENVLKHIFIMYKIVCGKKKKKRYQPLISLISATMPAGRAQPTTWPKIEKPNNDATCGGNTKWGTIP